MAMKRWTIAAAAAGFLVACLAIPVEGAEWCISDPAVNIRASATQSFTVYATEGVMGAQHQSALASAKISYKVRAHFRDGFLVTLKDYIPADSSGSFVTELIVSSKPFGAGHVYGSVQGRSGSTMTVRFWIGPENAR